MIYFDNASTTAVDRDICLPIIDKYSFNSYFNPSSQYHEALDVSKDIKKAREQLLTSLRGDGQIVFTSSGTESDNLALFGCRKKAGGRIIVSEAEHPAVMKATMALKQKGFDVVFAKCDSCGRVIFDEFLQLINTDTVLVSIMHINNETGGINDIKKLCNAVKDVNKDILFHSDGVQALGKTDINLRELGVDMYSMSAHKIYAPKGCGALFVKRGINLTPMLYGGLQESGIRSSTENVSGILCFCQSAELAVKNVKDTLAKLDRIRKIIKTGIFKDEKCAELSDEACLPHIFSFAMKYVRGEVMLHALERHGILTGTGSACAKGSHEGKKWRTEGLSNEYKNGILRLSFGKNNTEEEAEVFLKAFETEYLLLEKYGRM